MHNPIYWIFPLKFMYMEISSQIMHTCKCLQNFTVVTIYTFNHLIFLVCTVFAPNSKKLTLSYVMIMDKEPLMFPSKIEKQLMKNSSEVNWCSWWVCVSMLLFIPNQNLHIFVLSVKNNPCRHILQKFSVGNLSPLSFLILSPLSQINVTGRPVFLIPVYTSEEGMTEILGQFSTAVC